MSIKDALKLGKKVQRENRELTDDSKWTAAKIRVLLATNDLFVERALCVLLKRQTHMEQLSEHTNMTNHMGFTASDAKFGTSLAKQILMEDNEYKPGRRLSPKQRESARKMLEKYAQQLAIYSNTKDEVRVQEALGTMRIVDFQKGGTYGKVEQAGDPEKD